MNNTMTKYTVRVYCQLYDEMVDVSVAAENHQDSFQVAETQHDNECGSSICQCSPEASSSSEGWRENDE